MKVLVTGGTGYVGQPIVRELVRRQHDVIVLQRRQTDRPLTAPVEVIEGDIFDHGLLRETCERVDAVIHLVGIIREHPRQGVTMQRIHRDGTAAMVEVATGAGVNRFVHMSALGARANATSAYHQSKWAGEQVVRKSGLQFTIIRPAVVFGEGGPGPEFIGLLRNLVASTPIVPMIGHGQYPLQPVSIDTVAAAFAGALESQRAVGQTYELGGPEVITYRAILAAIAQQVNKPLRTIRIPVALMKRLVVMLQRLPSFPLTVDQLTMLLEGNVCTETESAYSDLSLEPIPFSNYL